MNLSILAILDENRKEVFINPLKILNDENVYHSISVSFDSDVENVDTEGFYVNGQPLILGREYSIFGSEIDDYYFLFNVLQLKNVEFNIKFKYKDEQGKNLNSIYGKIVCYKKFQNKTDIFGKNVSCLTDTNSSYQLIRTNPKLSGNIKLVVGSDQTLYLDTFKISENLNKFAYRHNKVSSESNFNTDVRNVFKSLSSYDLYKTPDVDLNVHEVHNDFDLQYDTTYEYGAETNTDELYEENFKILAPLWLNKKLPDFFAIFRVDDVCNFESYEKTLDDTEILKKFLKNAKMVKSVDMRKSSPLGKYLHNYYSNISEFPGSIMLQFKEQETMDRYDSGVNSWYGISVDSGLVVKKDEMSYFANEKIETGQQEYLNQFIIDGFERNRLLCPNIINLEFMFDDDKVDNYSMHRYFGLYLTENDFINYNFVEQKIDKKSSNYQIKKYDENYNEIDDSIISGQDSVLENENYKDRMFFGVSDNIIERLSNRSDLKQFIRQNVSNQVFENYKNCECDSVNTNNWKNFITLKFKKFIDYGEHFRIVIPKINGIGLDNPLIIEIIASNDVRLSNSRDLVCPYMNVSNGLNGFNDMIYYREVKDKPNGEEYESLTEEERQKIYFRQIDGEWYNDFPVMDNVRYRNLLGVVNKLHGQQEEMIHPYIFRTTFSTSLTEFDTLNDQIRRMSLCFSEIFKFLGLSVRVNYLSDDSVSIVSIYDEIYFQHITNDILNNDLVEIDSVKTDYVQLNSNVDKKFFNTHFGNLYYDKLTGKTEKDESISYFGRDDLDIELFALSYDSRQYESEMLMFAPLDFEILGWRKSSVVRFASFGRYNYEIQKSDSDEILTNTLVKSVTKRYVRLNDFNINSLKMGYFDSLRKLELWDYYVALYKEDKANYDQLLNLGVTDKTQEGENLLGNYKNEMIEIESFGKNIYTFKVSDNDVYLTRKDVLKHVNNIQSPFDLNKFLISTDEEIVLNSDGFVSLYSSKPFNVALMGILPIKDFDTTVENSTSRNINNKLSMTVPKDTIIYIDDENQDYFIKSGIFYKIEKGKIKNTSLNEGVSFIILNNVLYYNSGNSGDCIKTKKLSSDFFTTSSTNISTTIKQISSRIDVDFDLKSPELKIEKYFQDANKNNDLKYSLMSPTVCNWKGTGMYYDHDSLLRIENILKDDFKSIHKGYFSSSSVDYFKDDDMYISNTLDGTVDFEDKEVNFKEFLKETELTDSINLFLCDANRPEYTIGYYNKYIDSLVFTMFGVQVSLSLNNNQILKSVLLKEYNRYEIFILTVFNGEKDEVLINTIENTILIILHNFNFRKIDSNKNLFFGRQGMFLNAESYKWLKTDKSLDLNKTEVSRNHLYVPVSKNTNIDDKLYSEKIVQFNYFNQKDYDYEKIDKNVLMILNENISGKKYIDINGVDSGSIMMNYQNSFEMIHDSFRFMTSNIYETENWLINPEFEDESYVDMSNVSEKEKYEMMIDDLINSIQSNNLKFYIKQKVGEKIETIEIETNDDYQPFRFEFAKTSNVKYVTDFYNPNFKDIVEFELNEDKELMQILGINGVLGNTNISKVNPIVNYFGLKIFESIKEGNTDFNMFCLPTKSIISSDWDKNYYRLYKNDDFKNIDGFNIGIEDKSFFGSKGMKIKNVQIEVDEWFGDELNYRIDREHLYTTDNSKDNKENVVIELNLTQTFCNVFKENNIKGSVFRKNWSGFSTNTETGKNNFIKKSLINYFKIGNKNNIEIYSRDKENDTDDSILLKKPSDLNQFKLVKNFESEYSKSNNEVILKLILKDIQKQYYIKYNFKTN